MVPTIRSSCEAVMPFPTDEREQSLSRRSLRLTFSCKEMQNIVSSFFLVTIGLKEAILEEQFRSVIDLSVFYENSLNGFVLNT